MSTRASPNDTEPTVELEVLKNLLGYGVIGIVAVLAVLFARHKDKESREAKKAIDLLHASYQAKLEAANQTHRVEIEALLERYVSKAETWMEKYSEHARELRVLISALRGQNSG